jgi:hypothetical protein
MPWDGFQIVRNNIKHRIINQAQASKYYIGYKFSWNMNCMNDIIINYYEKIINITN